MKAVLAISLVLIAVFAWRFLGEETSFDEGSEVLQEEEVTRLPDSPQQDTPKVSIDPEGKTVAEDIAYLKNLFQHYRSAWKQNPIGTHQEILAALTGDNPQSVAYLPKNHPAIANGQLHDRWGTPFYFHQISGEVMEIRSAGPDEVHWNKDDITIR